MSLDDSMSLDHSVLTSTNWILFLHASAESAMAAAATFLSGRREAGQSRSGSVRATSPSGTSGAAAGQQQGERVHLTSQERQLGVFELLFF